jgi:4-alpha-glucanotransferase
MQNDRFSWWIQRMHTQLELFDLIRIDHFRGFEAFWEIPATAETAIEGKWVRAPGHALLKEMHDTFHSLPVIAEDLGTITEEVNLLRTSFDIPGMKILQFAFGGGPNNPYLPHNYEENCVVYTGTHDNDTTLSWFNSLDPNEQSHVMDYLGKNREEMPWPIIRTALASVALLCILPMQDILGLGEGHRMNTPGTMENNWTWRFDWDMLETGLVEKLIHINKLYGR